MTRPVTLSEAKGLKMRNLRSFAALRRLRMTVGHSIDIGALRRSSAQDDGIAKAVWRRRHTLGRRRLELPESLLEPLLRARFRALVEQLLAARRALVVAHRAA